MINERKLRLYEATMALNFIGANRFYKFLWDELSGKYYALRENVFDAGVEFLVAKWKRIIEVCEDFSLSKKEKLKQDYEAFIRALGICGKQYLKARNRLV